MTASSKDPRRTFVGAPALPLIYEHCNKMHQKGACKMEHAWPLQVFRYLLPEGLREPSQVLIKDMEKASIGRAKAQAKKPKGVKNDSAVSQAMALFLSSS